MKVQIDWHVIIYYCHYRITILMLLWAHIFFSLSSLVHAPAIVRDIDWASHVWPTDLPDDR